MNSQARIYEEKVYVRAVNPSSMLDNTFMIDYRDRDTALSYTEQLYTARGAQGMGTWKAVKQFGVDPSNYEDLTMIIYNKGGVQNANYKVRTLFTTKNWPDFCVAHTFMFALVNIPLWLQIQDMHMDEFTL